MNASSDVAALTSPLSQTLGSVVGFFKARLAVQALRTGAMTREVTRSLRLSPRGAIAHDVLDMTALSLRLRVEWQATDVHPWDRDLSEPQQAQLFARQCLEEVDAAITRLFERVPEMYVLELGVRDPRSNAMIVSGVVHRDDLPGASRLALEMKLRTVGMKYQLFDRRFEPAPSPDDVREAVAG